MGAIVVLGIKSLFGFAAIMIAIVYGLKAYERALTRRIEGDDT